MSIPSIAELAEYQARRTRLLQTIGAEGIAIVPAAREVIRNRDSHYKFRQDSDFLYLTGFNEPDSVVVLAPGRKEGAFLLFTRPRDKAREIWDGRRAGPEGAVSQYGADQGFVVEQLEAMLPQLLAGRTQIFYTLGEHLQWDAKLTACVREIREVSRRGPDAPSSFIALDSTLHEQRLIKTAAELQLIRKACDVSARAHVRAMRATKPGGWEWQVAAEIHNEFEQNEMEPGYGSIVGGGDNACILHYKENEAQLRDGDLLLIDAGGEYRGYTADITRTFPVSGKYSGAQKAVYEVVLAAQKAAIAELKPGVSSARPHEVATRTLTEGLVALGLLQGDPTELIATDKQRQFYMHGTGHWLGLDVHDVGRYKLEGRPRPFQAGMVMTVEPGLYIAPNTAGIDPRFLGIGIRIEDDVLIGAEGPEVLTGGVAKEVADVEAVMRG
ncbi:MAG: Xaa-Pro aminopeptidase [Nevskia sp.]|nr:Xaa-Pro aminopeptidase [Nevskia sp.]